MPLCTALSCGKEPKLAALKGLRVGLFLVHWLSDQHYWGYNDKETERGKQANFLAAQKQIGNVSMTKVPGLSGKLRRITFQS